MTSDDGSSPPPPGAVTCTVRPAPGMGAISFPVEPGVPVLYAMMRRALRVLPVGCRGGGCGVCRVRVVDGTYHTLRMSRRHVSEADEAQRLALACRLLPSSDIVVEAAPYQSPRPEPSDQPTKPATPSALPPPTILRRSSSWP